MLINKNETELLHSLFKVIRLKSDANTSNRDKEAKIDQILSYLEIINSHIRKYSKKRPLLFIDSCAGNCYLSFLVYYYYNKIENRPVIIHCIDRNEKLMDNGKRRAEQLGFTEMHFHTSDIQEFQLKDKVALVYSLHACDTATDKTLYLGWANRAACILSVSCCQHYIRRQIRGRHYNQLSRHSVFKDKLAAMVGDSLRALLMDMNGYKADLLEFTSGRNTGKNIMLRARKTNDVSIRANKKKEEYDSLKSEFCVAPALEKYIGFSS